MRTLYIPTTTLNFNNILSSESVSPKAFYQNRLFGYSRWYSIPENPFENSIVLYDQPGSFKRPKSDYEDHPLLLEVILDDEYEVALTQIDDHSYLLDRTIYLNPFTTKIFFFSGKDKKIALSLSDSSIETKFLRLYQKKISEITHPSYTYCALSSSKEKQSLNIKEIEKDKCINRMKGLLYGYYIGGLLSASLDDVVKLTTLREIHNVYAAILASVDHKATPFQYARLKELYSKIQPEIPLFSKLSKLVKEKQLFDAIISLIRVEYGYINGEIDINKKIAQLLSSAGKEGKNYVVEEVINQIHQLEYEMTKKAVRVSVQDDELVLSEGLLPRLNLSNVSEADKTLYAAWASEVLSKDEYSGKISTFKESLSDDVTLKAKEVFGAEWKGSYPEITLNALRRHVRGDKFNHEWKNDVYSALAAVIIRGDDWQKLLQFMQDKLMTDYRIAFSFYGAINGLANLPRDFTDILFNCDSAYIAEVYKEFYGQLFGKSIIIPSKIDSNQVVESTISVQEEKANTEVSTDKGIKTHTYQDILSDAKELILKNPPAKKIDADNYKKYYTQELDRVFCTSEDLKTIIKGIKSIPESVGKSKWKVARTTIIKYIEDRINKERDSRIKERFITHSLFPNSIIDDDDAVSIVKKLCGDTPIANLIISNFKDLQKGYRTGGFYYQRGDSRKNSDFIVHFKKFCFSDHNKYNRIPQTRENENTLNLLVEQLRKYYQD